MKLKKINWVWIVTGTLGLQFAGTALAAEDADIELLKKQIQELDQKVRILEREREIDQDGAAAAAKAAPKLTLGANGFSFASADSNYVAQLHGVVQFDTRTFFHDGGVNGNDGFLIRRARPILSGTFYHDFDYMFVPDFGGSTVQIQDAYVNYRYNPAFQLEVGKFKSPIGLEQLQADANTTFNERSLVTDLVPNRDLGVELHGDVLDGRASYAVGVFNGAPDYNGTSTNQSFQDYKALVGRVFFQPWKNSTVDALRGLGFGVAGSYEADHPTGVTGLTPGYTSDGQQKFFAYSGATADGTHWRVSPQAYYYYGPFGLLAEYAISDQRVSKNGTSADINNRAWELTGTWLLTGEDATYTGVTPLHPFDPRSNQWGAWQVVARFGELSVDEAAFTEGFASSSASANKAQAWSVGLDWFLNKNLRANLSYSHTVFSGYNGATSGISQPENVLFSRLQLSF